MRRVALALGLLLLASCSSRQSLFVVLPNPDGSSGAVTIEDGTKSVVLDQPTRPERCVEASPRR
jgi:hypothetical protein